MKKLIATILALATIFAMSTTAFAEDAGSKEINNTDDSKQATITVNGKYTTYKKAETVISVDVKWDAMNFTYALDAQGVWNPESHSYDDATESKGWTKDTATITVMNHSNTDIEAALAFDKATALSEKNITGTFTGSDLTDGTKLIIESADDAQYQATQENPNPDGPAKECEFGISGDEISTDTELGTITVSISAVEDSKE